MDFNQPKEAYHAFPQIEKGIAMILLYAIETQRVMEVSEGRVKKHVEYSFTPSCYSPYNASRVSLLNTTTEERFSWRHRYR